MSRIHTDLAVIRHALDIADARSAYAAERETGINHKTIYKWVKARAARSPEWPTQADIDAWRADDEARRDARARNRAKRAEYRKRHYLGLTVQPISPTGTMRRVQALYALGWTCPEIGARMGVSGARVGHILNGLYGRVTPETAARVRAVYDELGMTVPQDKPMVRRGDCPIHERARRDARRRGYAPPLAWDDDTIDDPAARPDRAALRRRQRRTPADLAEDVEDILSHNPLTTATEIAERLGYADNSGVQNGLERAGRPDLLARLARNAQLAGAAA
ncbi:MAG TPA: hypothetical protein VGF17_19025 [Phytomonospora sp.]